MTTVQPAYEPTLTFDFRKTLERESAAGHLEDDGGLSFAVYQAPRPRWLFSALAKTFTYLLLQYFVDDVLTQGKYIANSLTGTFIWIGAGFVGLAAGRRRIRRTFLDVWLLIPPKGLRGACEIFSSIISSV